jgi:hypothetical protein
MTSPMELVMHTHSRDKLGVPLALLDSRLVLADNVVVLLGQVLSETQVHMRGV